MAHARPVGRDKGSSYYAPKRTDQDTPPPAAPSGVTASDPDMDDWNYVDATTPSKPAGLHPFNKKTGKEYPCPECGKLFGHRDMIQSKRAKHAKLMERGPDSLDPETNQAPDTRTVFLKICVDCEAKERAQEGKGSTDIWEIKKELHWKNRGDEWGARGKFYKQAYLEVKGMEGLSKDQQKKRSQSSASSSPGSSSRC